MFVVPEMTGPIREMTRNHQLLEPLPFVLMSRHEKVKRLEPGPRTRAQVLELHWTCVVPLGLNLAVVVF